MEIPQLINICQSEIKHVSDPLRWITTTATKTNKASNPEMTDSRKEIISHNLINPKGVEMAVVSQRI